MNTLSRLLGLLESDDELERMLSDHIELYLGRGKPGDAEKAQALMKKYKEKIGRDYQPPKEFRPEPSLDRIYGKDDFERYQDYIKYSDDLYALKFHKYKGLIHDLRNPYMTWSQLQEFCNSLKVNVKIAAQRGRAQVRGSDTDTIYFHPDLENSSKIPIEVIIHEVGHLLDNQLGNIAATDTLFLHNRKTTEYDLNPAEIFAEGFKNYFVNPRYLKAGWPDVYKFFDRKIPGYWKKAIQKIV